jgi:hypothetical protein
MNLRLIAIAVPITAALAACSMPRMMDRMGMGSDMPKADPASLWSHLTKADYQKSFKLFPGKERLYQGGQPHGAWLSTHVNDTAFKALTSGQGALPAGSIIVKENYMPDKTLAAVTVMYKVAGYDAKNNDWYWLKRSADGKIDASGKVESCIACHAPAKRDYILTPITMR